MLIIQAHISQVSPKRPELFRYNGPFTLCNNNGCLCACLNYFAHKRHRSFFLDIIPEQHFTLKLLLQKHQEYRGKEADNKTSEIKVLGYGAYRAIGTRRFQYSKICTCGSRGNSSLFSFLQ